MFDILNPGVEKKPKQYRINKKHRIVPHVAIFLDDYVVSKGDYFRTLVNAGNATIIQDGGGNGITGFNGSSVYVQISGDASFDMVGDTEWSIVVGFTTTAGGNNQTIFDWGLSTDGATNWALQLDAGTPNIFARSSSTPIGPSLGNGSTVNDGRPHQIILANTNGDAVRGIQDGIYDAWSSTAASLDLSVADRLSFGRLGDSTPSSYCAATTIIHYLYIYKKDVYNEGLYREIYENPFVFLEPETIWMPYPAQAVGGATILPAVGSLSIAGQGALVAQSFTLTPVNDSISIAGQDISAVFGKVISPSLGLMTIDGQAVTVAVLTSIDPAAGSISVAGQDIDISTLRIISPSSATLSINGQSVTVDAVFVQVKETGFIFKLVGNLVPDLIKELIS